MKSFLLIIFLSTTCSSQVLTPKAKKLQEKNLPQFHAIETFAFKRHTNEIRRIKEINEQVEAFLEVRKMVFKSFDLDSECLKAVFMHSEKSKRENPFHNPTIDWKKVVFELRRRIYHKREY